MRHCNSISRRPCHFYSSFARPDSSRGYIKAIQYIADHPGCKRFDVLRAISPRLNDYVEKVGIKQAKHDFRGQASMLFADLLYRDFIDYNSKFEYYVTELGDELLKKAYLNDMKKIVTK